MHVLVTGAGGFVGTALVQRLLRDAFALPRPLLRLSAIDQRIDPALCPWVDDPRVQALEGDFADPRTLARALSPAPDWVFHLASVPGSLAEREQTLGLRVNLTATLALLQRVSDVRGASGEAPRVVFASSIAVYGALPRGGVVDESCPTLPMLSYGAHKRMTELFLADLSRRGLVDGLSLRLPGIVARPLSPTGHGSAFMSDVIRRLMAGEATTCPVSARAQAWWMSLPCCIDNLLHAAKLPAYRLPRERTVQLPVLTATMSELVATIEGCTGRVADVRWQPDDQTEALFGHMPRLQTPHARDLGFRDDGSLLHLVRHALDAAPAISQPAFSALAEPAPDLLVSTTQPRKDCV